MTELSIDLNWTRITPELAIGKYENAHHISFNNDHAISADAAPDWGGNPDFVNPAQFIMNGEW